MISSNGQFYIFLFYVFLGMLSGAIYAIFHLGMYFKRSERGIYKRKWFRILSDTICAIVCLAVLLGTKLKYVVIDFRLYSAIGLILGAYISYFLAIKPLDKRE